MLFTAAYEYAMRMASNNEETFNAFLTFSVADLHSDDLHRHLPGSDAYLPKTVVQSWADIPVGANAAQYITKREDYEKRMKVSIKCSFRLCERYFFSFSMHG